MSSGPEIDLAGKPFAGNGTGVYCEPRIQKIPGNSNVGILRHLLEWLADDAVDPRGCLPGQCELTEPYNSRSQLTVRCIMLSIPRLGVCRYGD